MNCYVRVYTYHEIFKKGVREYMETLKICGVKLRIKTLQFATVSVVKCRRFGVEAQTLSNKDHACYTIFLEDPGLNALLWYQTLTVILDSDIHK